MLQAEEMMVQANAVALGSGTLDRNEAYRLRRELEAQARRSDEPPPRPSAAQLASMGIGVRNG